MQHLLILAAGLCLLALFITLTRSERFEENKNEFEQPRRRKSG